MTYYDSSQGSTKEHYILKSKITRAELLLLGFSITITLFLSLGLIRWLAPELLGVSSELVLVQSEKQVQPFYENLFREEHRARQGLVTKEEHFLDFFLPDPFVKSRAKPLLADLGGAGPHDLLGFRNLSVPITADVIIIGDSQTYGNNAVIWKNWPHNLQLLLPQDVSIYSMATGSWTALQYYYAFQKARFFSPSVVVIAFYTGNDPLEAYTLGIASNNWKDFLPAEDIKSYGTPDSHFPPPASEQWQVKFEDGVETVFVPSLRRSSNLPHKAIDAGYEIMLRVAGKIAEEASADEKLDVVFTIIPTKEFVYSKKVFSSDMQIDPEYRLLINDEGRRIEEFSAALKKIGSSSYVDISTALQEAALSPAQLYPKDINGHPLASGYNVIATAMAPAIRSLVSGLSDAFYFARSSSGTLELVYLENHRFWFVANPEKLPADKTPATIPSTKLFALEFAGHLYLD